MSNAALLNDVQARIAAIALRADGVRNAGYRTLPRLSSLDLPFVFVVPVPANDEILDELLGTTTRTFELNVYAASVEQGKFNYQGLDLAQDLIAALRAVFDDNPRLELDALNDGPDWVLESVVTGDSGYTVFQFASISYAGAQLTLQVTSLKYIFNQLPPSD